MTNLESKGLEVLKADAEEEIVNRNPGRAGTPERVILGYLNAG
jgi:hypothetical protein